MQGTDGSTATDAIRQLRGAMSTGFAVLSSSLSTFVLAALVLLLFYLVVKQ
ncbi:MAG: hypothetical protein NTW59_02470 [Candidatus Diapherotrites archaeon]|nr:hypothetical protein [Candidatus Diapherotrites archaeon]